MVPDDEDAAPAKPPQHPVPTLQGPFEESMMESLNDVEDGEQKTDSISRRKMLLQGEKYERVCAGRWKQRPGEKFHPLWKLSAQLSFGLHLLAQGLAKSEEEVMRILQSHVDDIDGFLERTTEDFDLAQHDVEERLRYLQLPFEHVDVFDQMLEDRSFRTSIVEGNEKIEHIVERTSEAMNDAFKDVQKGIEATGALGKYLTDLKSTWTNRTPELDAVYVAMLGNVEGWTRAFEDLHLQGKRLAVSLVQLAGIVAEMQRRAGVASRKGLLPPNAPPSNGPSRIQESAPPRKVRVASPDLTSRRSPTPMSTIAVPNKPLPSAPDLMGPARQASRAKLAHQEKVKRRSLEVLKEQEEKAKAPQAQPARKLSMAEKVRSVTKRGPTQAISGRTRSPKPSEAKPLTASRAISPNVQASKVMGRDSAAPSPAPTDNEDPHRFAEVQPSVVVELPAEVLKDNLSKSGIHIHLGSKHKTKEQGSRSSSSKSLNLFRRSPQLSQPSEAHSKSKPVEATTSSPETTEKAQSAQTQPTITLLSPQSLSSPQRQSPDPGLPTPPALLSTNIPQGLQSNSYTALPGILATAQRAKTVKASLKVSVPSSTDQEAERTPRAIPSQQSESLPQNTQAVEVLRDDTKKGAVPEAGPKHKSVQSNLGEPGPEVRTLNTAVASVQSMNLQDDEKTPTSVKPSAETPVTRSNASQERGAELIDTTLTSATMRSYSDFCKLPPQQTSPTPPPITPDELAANQSIASNVTPTTGPIEPSSAQQPNAHHSAAPSPQIKRSSREKKATGPEESQVNPKSEDPEIQCELLDLIPSTPGHSPIHTCPPSEAPTLSTTGMSTGASRNLGPPEEAPPPPAPGGRSMITPDYAAAGAFEGERKSRRGSGTSTGGWKKMFSGSGGPSSPAATTGNSVGVVGVSGSKGEEEEEIIMSANLMSSEGTDVLWYKGMGRDGLWVSKG